MLYAKTSKDIEDIDVSLIKLGDSEMSDPWKHRSDGMKCKTCMWFVEKAVNAEVNADRKPFGRCRRHAPTMMGYPAVYGDDWCGDHKLDENKT